MLENKMHRMGIYCIDQDRQTTSTLGVYHYTRNLIRALADLSDPGFQVYLLVAENNASDFVPDNIPSWMHIQIVKGKYSSGIRRFYADHILSVRYAKELRLDLLHFPKGWIPLTPLSATRVISTVCDAIPHLIRRRASTFPEWAKTAYFSAMLNHSIRRANRIITISGFSCSEILKIEPRRAKHIDVIPLGTGLPISNHEPFPLKTRTDFTIIGSAIPHKATQETLGLLDQYAAVKDIHLPVVMTGLTGKPHGWPKPSDRLQIRWVGRISDNEMVNILSNSRVIFFLSTIEGFGLPLLDGYSAFTPVCFRDIPPMNEILHDCPGAWDGNNTDSFIRTLDKILTLDMNGIKCVRDRLLHKYSWALTAQRTAETYHFCMP